MIAAEARPSQVAEALAWVQEHKEMLALKWVELNERKLTMPKQALRAN